MKKALPLFYSLLSFFLILNFSACVREKAAPSDEIKSYQSGSLHVSTHKDAPRTIYIDLGASRKSDPALSREMAKALAEEHFQVADSPSEAGYILHISVLQEGNVSPDVLKSLVNAGYGSEARFAGKGATGLLADALLVQRRVPQAARPSRARLKNISERNALESTQMRVGLLASPGTGNVTTAFSDALVHALANALAHAQQTVAEE